MRIYMFLCEKHHAPALRLDQELARAAGKQLRQAGCGANGSGSPGHNRDDLSKKKTPGEDDGILSPGVRM